MSYDFQKKPRFLFPKEQQMVSLCNEDIFSDAGNNRLNITYSN